MTRIEFDQLVEALESRYRGKGSALTRTVLVWALMGYAALLLGLALSLGSLLLSIGMMVFAPNGITIKFGIIFGISGAVVSWAILKGAWVRVTPPQGELLTPAKAPRLFEVIDSISARAGGIRFHRVLLTGDLNACVVQVPRLGVFGWHRNYLCLGMQLLDALSPEEVQAVLAHEFAHLSRAHGRTGNWLYRIRRSWENVTESLASQGGILVKPLASFLSWFWPRFNARAFVLSRQNEYEADAFGASVTTPAVQCGALARIAVESQRIDRDFWDALAGRSATEADPPSAIFEELAGLFKTRIDPADAERWFAQQFARSTDTSDTHPALKDRVAALCPGAFAPVLEPIRESAADGLLGVGFAREARSLCSREWLENHGEQWHHSHEHHAKLRERLAELDASGDSSGMSWDRLRLECEIKGVSAMREELVSFLGANPSHQVARYILGNHLLSEGDSSGVAMLERVLEGSPHIAIQCFASLADFHDRQGDSTAVRNLKRRADAHEKQMHAALVERSEASSNQSFEVHGLTAGEVAGIARTLAAIPEVRQAWLARRLPRLMPGWKSYVMIVTVKFPALRLVTEETKMGVLQQVADSTDVDGHLLVVTGESKNVRLAQRIRSIPGTQVFEASGAS